MRGQAFQYGTGSNDRGDTTNALLELTNNMEPLQRPHKLIKCESSDASTATNASTFSDEFSCSDASMASPSNQSTSSRCSNGRTGRFSPDERKILVSLIWQDLDVLSAFCHQHRKQSIQGKSFMHLITDRFNEKTSQKRSHDAVRHHLKLRRSNLGPALDRSPQVTQIERDFRMLEKLLEHRWVCSDQDACTRCLQMHRLRVQRGLASCGKPSCVSCDPALPTVRESFDARELLLEVRRRFYSKVQDAKPNADHVSPTYSQRKEQQQQQQQPLPMPRPISPCLGGTSPSLYFPSSSSSSSSSSTSSNVSPCPSNLTSPPPSLGSPCFSPDGENHAFSTNQLFEPLQYTHHSSCSTYGGGGFSYAHPHSLHTDRQPTSQKHRMFSAGGTAALANLLNFTKTDVFQDDEDQPFSPAPFRQDSRGNTNNNNGNNNNGNDNNNRNNSMQYGSFHALDDNDSVIKLELPFRSFPIQIHSPRATSRLDSTGSVSGSSSNGSDGSGASSPIHHTNTASRGMVHQHRHLQYRSPYGSTSPPISPVSPASTVMGISVDDWFSPSHNKRSFSEFQTLVESNNHNNNNRLKQRRMP